LKLLRLPKKHLRLLKLNNQTTYRGLKCPGIGL